MLDDTLVIWGGEFGRTPTVELPTPGSNEGKMNGRDHNHYGFTMWLAGGGVEGGPRPRRHRRVRLPGRRGQGPRPRPPRHDPPPPRLRPRDSFTYRYAGRDFRLTDVHGKVVKDVVA